MYELYIANKNYSSWSLRAWLLMKELGIEFVERLTRFDDAASWQTLRLLSPAGMVPCLVDDSQVVWDSLAIAEYLAEAHPGVWPVASPVRAWARSAAAEMHSGFMQLRQRCSMSCGLRVRLHERPAALEREIARITQLWNEGLARFGGPFLGGSHFSAVDAFFAPIAFRIQTYELPFEGPAAAYASRLLALPSMQAWYGAALEESARDAAHEAEVHSFGSVLQDLRSPDAMGSMR